MTAEVVLPRRTVIGSAPVSAASVWGFGSWVEFVPALNNVSMSIGRVTFMPTAIPAVDTTEEVLLEIGTGAAGAEVVQIQVPFTFRSDTAVAFYFPLVNFHIPDPYLVAASTRIAVRVADSNAAARTYQSVRLHVNPVTPAAPVVTLVVGDKKVTITAATPQQHFDVLAAYDYSTDGGVTFLRRPMRPGNVDPSFDASTATGVGVSGGVEPVGADVHLQADGRLVIVGRFVNAGGVTRNGLVRCFPDGTPDNTFNAGPSPGGLNSSSNPPFNRLLPTPGGGFVAIGANISTFRGLSAFNPIWITDAGTPQESLNRRRNYYVFSVQELAYQADGKLLMGGFGAPWQGTSLPSIQSNRLFRYNTDGSPDFDFNFNTGSVASQERSRGVTGSLPNGNATVFKIIVQPDQKILVFGQFWNARGLFAQNMARFNQDGTLDTTFNNSADGDIGATGTVNDAVLLPDGKIIIAGEFATVRTTNIIANTYLCRLTATGTVDLMAPASVINLGLSTKIWLQADGKVIVQGQGPGFGRRLFRFNSDLTQDLTWQSPVIAGATFTDQINALQFLPDGRMIVVGDFTSLDGVTANGVGRLMGDTFPPITRGLDLLQTTP